MAKVKDLFKIENAKSKGYESYNDGNIPFVTNGSYENSIVGFVEPFEKDKVFHKSCICLSSFCEATIQTPPFLPRGNGGSGLVILEPKKEMSEEELYFYTAQINNFKWRFSYSRMLIGDRIKNLELFEYKDLSFKIQDKLKAVTPKEKKKEKINYNSNIKVFDVIELCNVKKKTALPQNVVNLDGNTPYVTTTSMNNGVSMLCGEEPNFEKKCLSVSLNGSCGDTFYQIDDFITSSDNAVLTLKKEKNVYLLLYIGVMIRNNKWRYNYYRKLTKTKLEKLKIPIPMKNEKIDLDYIEKIIKNSYCFNEVKAYL